jgi:hypothetical protein
MIMIRRIPEGFYWTMYIRKQQNAEGKGRLTKARNAGLTPFAFRWRQTND